ncbi:hypothetical protein KC19_9G109900 [Ceratodon purpureus]|uniref:Reverse transcriptase zinc-binding domain-containing protein n=1 Tax=Ceratodon purpureus TaxID=3225 RepID=A0A8T0GTW5_CERPU|nr:hypothetical protein KC19_9G109900 [Ceratodon purpureus]
MAWKKMNAHLCEVPPSNDAEVLQTQLWWGVKFKGGDFNVAKTTALSLFNRGLCKISDLWDSAASDFKSLEQLRIDFRLDDQEVLSVSLLLDAISTRFRAQLGISHQSIGPGVWIAGYGPEPQDEPLFAVQACRTWGPGDSSQMERFRTLPSGYPIFHIGQQSRMLIPANGPDAYHKIRNWTGNTAVARIVLVEKSKSKQSFAYYGKVGDLQGFDPVLWKWKNGDPFTLYTAKIGKELLSNRDQLKKPIAEKWRHETNFQPKPDWKAVWSDRSKKESAFLWSVLHQAVATNAWRARFNPQASPDCPLCGLGIQETNSHRLRMMGALRAWALLRGIILWGSWILRNEAVFEGTVWSNARGRRYIWDSLLEYGRVEWDRTLKKLKSAKSPEKAQSALCEFDSTWTAFEVLCVRDGLRVSWKHAPPDVPLIFW